MERTRETSRDTDGRRRESYAQKCTQRKEQQERERERKKKEKQKEKERERAARERTAIQYGETRRTVALYQKVPATYIYILCIYYVYIYYYIIIYIICIHMHI